MKHYLAKWLITLFVILTMVSFAWAGDIHDAAAKGDMGVLKQALAAGNDAVNSVDDRGRTPLMIAALNGHTEAVALLLEKGAKINIHAEKDQQRTALHYAVWKGHTETARLLLKKGALISAPEVDGETPLHYAGASTPETLALLLKNGGDINRVSAIGTTPLYYAVLHGNAETTAFLIQNGAAVKIKRGDGLTLLHLAARSELPLDQVSVMVEKGLSADGATEFGYTPLHYAVLGKRCDVAALLIKKGAAPDHEAKSGETPLELAIRHGNDKMVALLLKAGADAGVLNSKTGTTPLIWAAARGYSKIVNLLLKAGADANQADKKGVTPLQYAFKGGHKSSAKALMQGGAAKDPLLKGKGRFGNSPLLKKELQDGQAIVWYLGHSGWAIKTGNHLLVIDYFSPYPAADEPLLANGHINPEEIKDMDVTVMVTHGHRDHYDPAVFKWRETIPGIHYLLGFQPDTKEKYTFLPPRKTIKGHGMTVTAIRSNDEGVGFFVEVDGVKILHMGDHANGDPKLAGDFTPEIDFLRDQGKVKPHLFFTPVSGCRFRGRLEALRKGVHYTFKTLEPGTLFPMHGLNREQDYVDFAKKCKAEGLKTAYCCAAARGDIFAWFNGKVKGAGIPCDGSMKKKKSPKPKDKKHKAEKAAV